jgi:adenylate cyclase class IV
MAKLQEIENKWDAAKVERADFNKQLLALFKKQKIKNKFLSVKGFDYYLSSKAGHVIRHRVGKSTNELTVKARMNKNSTTIRAEGNIAISSTNDIREVHGTLKLLGFDNVMAIYKDCDIYFFSDGIAELSVVWYVVKYKGRHDRVFIEIEIHGLPQRSSMKYLNKWSNIFYKLYGISKTDIVPHSLYEIYSGKKYRMVKRQKKAGKVIPLRIAESS